MTEVNADKVKANSNRKIMNVKLAKIEGINICLHYLGFSWDYSVIPQMVLLKAIKPIYASYDAYLYFSKLKILRKQAW